MSRLRMFATLVAMLAIVGAGCKKDKSGSASLSVRTEFPEGVPVTLVSVERPGTYVEHRKTDLGGSLSFTGVSPGKYTLVYQFNANDRVPTHVPYNYGESAVLDVQPGRNVYEWTFATGKVERK